MWIKEWGNEDSPFGSLDKNNQVWYKLWKLNIVPCQWCICGASSRVSTRKRLWKKGWDVWYLAWDVLVLRRPWTIFHIFLMEYKSFVCIRSWHSRERCYFSRLWRLTDYYHSSYSFFRGWTSLRTNVPHLKGHELALLRREGVLPFPLWLPESWRNFTTFKNNEIWCCLWMVNIALLIWLSVGFRVIMSHPKP